MNHPPKYETSSFIVGSKRPMCSLLLCRVFQCTLPLIFCTTDAIRSILFVGMLDILRMSRIPRSISTENISSTFPTSSYHFPPSITFCNKMHDSFASVRRTRTLPSGPQPDIVTHCTHSRQCHCLVLFSHRQRIANKYTYRVYALSYNGKKQKNHYHSGIFTEKQNELTALVIHPPHRDPGRLRCN